MVSAAPTSALICRASTAPARLMLLMCAFFQRKSSALTQATPVGAALRPRVDYMRLPCANTVGVMPGGITWSRMATPRVTWR